MMPVSHAYTGLLGDVAELMVSVEEDHSLAGWDNSPPTLYRVERDDSGTFGLDPVRLHSDALGLPRLHPRQILAGIAAMPSSNSERVESLFSRPPIAHLLVMEAYMRSYSNPEEREAERRSLADIPGSIEVRWAVGIIGEHMLYLSRVRGKSPEFIVEPEGVSGGMADSLRTIHSASAKVWRNR